ncbi:hypothetical protein BegalDRAFT_1411 [Beggiatoa alba B18LD]|uniref:Thioredoxin-like fold domain-containing protein n=2 Tax=Beggiatoa alba TaxID=1022 RepID=I3CFB0_9GAMM|nr:hypothetical protein BegalDRAFT_1411 [Beggiatoa alba B18LD]
MKFLNLGLYIAVLFCFALMSGAAISQATYTFMNTPVETTANHATHQYCSQILRSTETGFLQQTNNLQILAKQARGQQQFVLILYEMNDCAYCEQLKKTVLNQTQVIQYFKQKFQIATLNIESEQRLIDFAGQTTSARAFATQQRIFASPTFGFYRPTGEVLTLHQGTFDKAEDFLMLGRYVVEAIYEQLPFSAYRRQAATDAI